MERAFVTRAYLESLTTDDLFKIADDFGVDIPPGLDRPFIIGELLDIALADVREFGNSSGFMAEETDMMDTVLTESVPLPRQYNITFVEVMIRDPLWAFVFWEIKAQDKEHFEKAPDFGGYYLKVSPWAKPAGAPRQEKADTDNFTVSVNPNDTAWYLGLTSFMVQGITAADNTQYKLELCAGLGGNETVLAASGPIRLPGLPELPSRQEKLEPSGAWENPLIRLSGYEDFHILRKNERQPRTKRAAPARSHEQ